MCCGAALSRKTATRQQISTVFSLSDSHQIVTITEGETMTATAKHWRGSIGSRSGTRADQ
jgi:hypothetical protein